MLVKASQRAISSLAIWLVTDVRTEESHQPHEQAPLPLLSLQILCFKLSHSPVVAPRLGCLIHCIEVTFHGAGVWSVTEADGRVLFLELDLPRHRAPSDLSLSIAGAAQPDVAVDDVAYIVSFRIPARQDWG
jgi:hypothetical protein